MAVNVALFLVKVSGMDHMAIASFAVVPTDLIAVKYIGGPAMGPLDRFAIPEWATLVSYMFFHSIFSIWSATCCSCGCSATTSKTPSATSNS